MTFLLPLTCNFEITEGPLYSQPATRWASRWHFAQRTFLLMPYRLHYRPTRALLCEDRYKQKYGPFAVGFSCCLQRELMESRWLQLNVTANSRQRLRQGSSKSANSHCFTPAENLALHINRKKKNELPYPNQFCPACWSCQQRRKFMLVLIMALKSSLMKNYLWFCLFWARFTHSTWVTSASFHLITDVLSQNAEYLGLKTRTLQTQVHMEHFFWQGP